MARDGSSSAVGIDKLFVDPEPREVRCTLISVDDHLVEPPDMFAGRVPARFADRAPRVIDNESGGQSWEFDGRRIDQIGANAVAGRDGRIAEEPTRFDQMRRGCWDIDARVRDMDINGVWASLNFPSVVSGFCGRIFSAARDPELGIAVTRAWNDWMFESWYGPYPERIIPLGITFLTDPEEGAREVRRNAARGFRAVSLPERPHLLGYPAIFSGYWTPIVEACAETDTVICLHVGSSGLLGTPEGSPPGLGATMFGPLAVTACIEWLWSDYPVRFPTLKIAMSEGGIGWVPMLIERLEKLATQPRYGAAGKAELLLRNFWFCTIDDGATMELRDKIGVDNIMAEVDYPHGDSTWPDSQEIIHELWGRLPAGELRQVCCENAARLFRHPLPPLVVPRG